MLRVAVFHERWQCLGEEGCALDPAHAAPLSEAPRMAPATLRGDWKVFDISAVPIEETDVETGVDGVSSDMEHCVNSGLHQQLWGTPAMLSWRCT